MGTSESLFTTQTPATEDSDFDIPSQLGVQFTVAVGGQITGGRYWRPTNTMPATAKWQLWRVSDQVKLAEFDMTTLSSVAGWNTFAITPVSVVTTESYVVCSYTVGGSGRIVYTTGATYPLTNGNLTASTGRFKNGGTAADFPDGTEATYFFADVQFTASGGGGTTHSATAAGASTSTGSAAVTLRMAAAAAGASTSAGSAAVTLRLAAAATGASTSTGSAAATIVPPGPVTWQAAASGSSTSAGAATVTLKMAATAIGASVSTGTATPAMRLAAVASGSSTSSGSADAGRLMAALAVAAAVSAGSALAVLVGPVTSGTMRHATRTAAGARHATRAAASAAAITRTMARASGARRSGPTTTGR